MTQDNLTFGTSDLTDTFNFVVDDPTTIDVAIIEPEADKAIREAPIGYFFDEDTFNFIYNPNYYLPGTIFEGDNSNQVLKGTFDSDIFISWDITNFTANGYAGSDIFIYWNSAGTINGGMGEDIIDLTNFKGTINLGNDLDVDTLLIWELAANTTLKIDNFKKDQDVLMLGENVNYDDLTFI